MDTDSENENENEVNLTGFLFGNIDSAGRLVDDIFDSESKKQLSSLARLGVGSLLDVMHEQDLEDGDDSETAANDNEDYDKKSDTAEDFSDINELADDLQTAMQPSTNKAPVAADDYDDIEAVIPATTVRVEPSARDSVKAEAKGLETISTDTDKKLMPPPSIPLKSQISHDSSKSEKDSGSSDEGKKERDREADRKLETPLAAMLPSKYANVDVRELFPDFRPDKVLRFSRLFGPGKPTSLPQIWRSVRKKRRKRKQSRENRQKDGSDSTSETEERMEGRNKGYLTLSYGPDPPPDQIAVDDEYLLLREVSDEALERAPDSSENGDSKPKVADWRYGPAQVWYDMLDVPASGDGFNYGFKTKDPRNDDESKNGENTENVDTGIPEDAYLMVSQLHWEDDVVWDGQEIKSKVLQKLNSKTNLAGWLPSSGSRTAGAFSQPGKGSNASSSAALTSKASNASGGSKLSKGQALLQKLEEADDTWYSIFPVENEELIYSRWEDEVIWDPEAMPKVPKPKMLSLDPNDENIILGIPDDIDPSKLVKNTRPPPKIKIPHPHVKKSKILLGKAGVINVLAEDTPPPPPKSPDRDPFNISNDTFYMAKSSESTMRMKVGGGNLIQHSTPVVELRAPFIPTHMNEANLRAFHRPPMRKITHGPLADSQPHGVQPLLKHIKKKAKQRELERIASGGGDVFFMRNPEDLSGKDGELILVEFTEEHPPLMNQVGMCSKIKNYYKRKAEKDTNPPEFRFGEIAYAHTSPFLGILQPGRCIQTLENNMYRAPIYSHAVAPSDFLLIRTRNEYYIREVDALFTVAQECPLYEVPGPNSKRANNFVRDFLQVFIYRLFWKSRDMPRRIRMDDIKRAFPGHSESSIRKRLKQCADFKRTGMDSNWWVIKPEFRLPSEEEIRAMVSPEQCCAYFSMIAAEQRLKDAGYGEKSIFAQQDDDDEEQQLKMDDEVKVAPWNTTRAYIQAMRGKCLLQLTGPADPTGMGEGFSYVRIPNKPTQTKEEIESQPKRTVTGTDADLRRLSLQNAKEILRKYDVPEEEIKKLSRWEVIDVVRTLSTEKSKAGEEGMDKFSRGNRFSIAEHQERYKEECQRIFDLQNKVLASSEVLSTDEGESTVSEESDLEELGKNLENMLANKKTSVQLSMEREEQERQELLKKIMEEREAAPKDSKKKEETSPIAPHLQPGRILKITRTFKNSEGKEFTRVEIVRRPQVIDAYVRIRQSKDEAFIRQFATLDEAQKEEMKREKRRIQEQLRRIKRNQEKVNMMQQQNQNQHLLSQGVSQPLGDSPTSASKHGSDKKEHASGKEISPSRRKIKLKPDLKLKCGACGQVGHMRTNKACPLYTGTVPAPSLTVAMTEEQEEDLEKALNADDEDLVNVDGTKVKLSGKLLKRREKLNRLATIIKIPREAVGGKSKRRRAGADNHCDYLRHNKTAKRSRTDPVVVMSSILEQILSELRELPDVQPFIFPVNIKKVPDYYKVVQRPMDLQAIRENLRQNKYQSREDFLADVNQIVENCSLYNGPKSPLTSASQRMLQKCVDCLAEKEERLMRLEKAINPLLDDDDQVALSFIFEKLLNEKLKNMRESNVFKKPVNKKQFKDYYTVIRKPMDLETISKKIAAHKYHSRADFIADISLIATNCEQYNGAESELTKDARVLVDFTRRALDEFADHCSQLEKNIALVQERAKMEAEMDDTWADVDDNDTSRNMSRASSPENDFVDVESTDNNRPQSAASGTSQLPSTSAGIPITPEKRNRGRPRKIKENPEDPKSWKKRGRGRPRKNSITSDMSNTQNSYLEEDLQFTTDEDEEFEEVVGEMESVAATLGQGEALARSSQPVNYAPGGHNEEDSKQAAEAMVQLSGVGFYNQQDESMDLDPNYDPSDFLQMPSKKESNIKVEYSNIKQEPQSQPQNYDQDSSFNMSEMLMYEKRPAKAEHGGQAQSESSTDQAQSQPNEFATRDTPLSPTQSPSAQNESLDDVGIHDDLAISDSDEEQQQAGTPAKNQSENANDNDADLWF